MRYIVYKHTSPSNKVYIGITAVDPEKRWGGHGQGYHKQLFHKAIEKYGWENFKHEIMYHGISRKMAIQKEMELIKEYNSTNPKYGYNVSDGGYATNKGRILSVDARVKISKANTGHTPWNKGKHWSKEVRRKISKGRMGIVPWNKGIPRTEEEKKKMSENRKGILPWNTGKKYSEERCRKMSEDRLNAHYGNPIICVETGEQFYSSTDAERKTGIDHSRILKCVHGKAKTAGKKHWKLVYN